MFNALLSVSCVVHGNELTRNSGNTRSSTLRKCFSISVGDIRCFICGPVSHLHNSSPSEFPQSHCFCCQEAEKKQELVKKMLTVTICDSEKLSPALYRGTHLWLK